MKFLLILLLYHFGVLVTSDFCNATCLRKTTLVPIFSQNSSIKADLIRLHLLSQVNSCFRGPFSVDVYLAASEEWMQCCDARSCSRAILNIEDKEFFSKSFSDAVDEQNSSGVLKIGKEIKAKNSTPPYVLTNIFSSKLWNGNFRTVLITNGTKADLSESNETAKVLTYDELPMFSKPSCPKSRAKNRVTCDTQPIGNNDTGLELRIFLGFSSEGHFIEILSGLGKLLSEELFDGQIGKIFIFGPRAKRLARCWWYNAHKCILQLLDKGNSFIYVKTDKVSRDDVEFAPDVMGFMRREAIKDRELPPTIVLVLSDFISVNFLDTKYIFEKALQAQKVAIIYGIILPWNKLDKSTVMKYYGQLLSSADLYPLKLFSDLKNIADRILNISFDKPALNESINTTLEPSQPGVPITETPHPSDVIIVLALAHWTNLRELELLKTFLNTTAANCANEEHKYAIQKSSEEDESVFCADKKCFVDQVNRLQPFNTVSDYDDTVNLIKHALDTLKPKRMPTEKEPSVFLVTNYVSGNFLRDLDDSKSEFRTNLSFVNFQVMLINTSNVLHVSSSLPNRAIHVSPTFDDLKSADNIFCPTQEYRPTPDEHQKAKIGTLGVAVLCVSAVVLFIALTSIAYTVHKKMRRRKISRMSDKEPIISREFDELGQEILNISGLARTRVDPWEMSRQQIIQSTELGRGSGGVVYRGSILGRAPCEYIYRGSFYAYQYDNCPVAIKEQLIGSDEKGRQQLLDEIEIMKAIRPHQNIANMLGCVTTVNPVCLAIEYAEGGSLKQFLKGKLVLPTGNQLPDSNVIHQRDVLSYLWQIADGLAFVHNCGVIHRDVAARNVLIKRGRDVLIADFGLAIWKESSTSLSKIKRLPIKWTPPEALSRAQFGEASDVWSFGVCAWEILMSGADPFDDVPTPEILSYLHSGRRLERPEVCLDPLWRILKSCWLEETEKRPSFNFIKTELSMFLEDSCSGYGYVTPLRE